LDWGSVWNILKKNSFPTLFFEFKLIHVKFYTIFYEISAFQKQTGPLSCIGMLLAN
jgi:hypothetical protein